MTFKKVITIILAMSAILSMQVYAQDAPVQPTLSPDTFATINGEPVAKSDFYTRLENVPITTQNGPIPAGVKAAEDLFNETLVLQYAKNNGAAATDAQIQAKLDFFKKQAGGNMDMFLMQTGMSLDQLKQKLTVQQSFVNVLTKNIVISDEDVKKNYDAALKAPRSPYKAPDEAELSIIVVADAVKAKKAYQKLQTGADFVKVATQFSEAPAGKTAKGNKALITEGTPGVPDDIFKAAWKLEKGKYTNTLKASDKKWYIAKMGDKKPGTKTPFEDVKELLKEQMAVEKAGANASVMTAFQQFVKDSKITAGTRNYQSIADGIKAQAAAGLEKIPTNAGNPQ